MSPATSLLRMDPAVASPYQANCSQAWLAAIHMGGLTMHIFLHQVGVDQ